MSAKITVVIPTFNEAESLPRLIRSLEEILPRDELGLIIIDDNSLDNGNLHIVGLPLSVKHSGNRYALNTLSDYNGESIMLKDLFVNLAVTHA